MANVAKTHLFDKDIKNLAPQIQRYKPKRYFKVGDPKELCVFVNPKGTKKFSLRLKQKDKVVWYELKELRKGIYSVAEARKDALEVLKRYQQLGSVDLLKNGNEKYSFGKLFRLHLERKRNNALRSLYQKNYPNVREIPTAKPCKKGCQGHLGKAICQLS